MRELFFEDPPSGRECGVGPGLEQVGRYEQALRAVPAGGRFPLRAHARRHRQPGRALDPQQARNLLLDLGERTTAFTYLIRDRAGQFTTTFDSVLADAGIAVLKIPPRSPQANAYAERFVLTVRTELTDRMLVLGQRHLRSVLTTYYNGQRPHRSLRPKPAVAGETFPCPRILQLTPQHGSPRGGYPLRVVGVHLPPVVVIHFQQGLDSGVRDIRITTHSTAGRTKAVITLSQQSPGAEPHAAVYPEGWPLYGTPSESLARRGRPTRTTF